MVQAPGNPESVDSDCGADGHLHQVEHAEQHSESDNPAAPIVEQADAANDVRQRHNQHEDAEKAADRRQYAHRHDVAGQKADTRQDTKRGEADQKIEYAETDLQPTENVYVLLHWLLALNAKDSHAQLFRHLFGDVVIRNHTELGATLFTIGPFAHQQRDVIGTDNVDVSVEGTVRVVTR